MNGEPVTDYKDIKAQLRKASTRNFPAKTDEKPFVTFPEEPLAADTLVSHADGRLGQISKCINPSEKNPSKWKYQVGFGDGKEADISECDGDDLCVRMNLRWMSKDVVLGLIPNSLEDTVNDMQPKVDSLGRKLSSVAYTLNSIVSWNGKVVNTLFIDLGLFFLSFIFFLAAYYGNGWVMVIAIFLGKIILVAAVLAIHVYGADFMVLHRTKAHASKDVEDHKAKDYKNKWPFFHGDDKDYAAKQGGGSE